MASQDGNQCPFNYPCGFISCSAYSAHAHSFTMNMCLNEELVLKSLLSQCREITPHTLCLKHRENKKRKKYIVKYCMCILNSTWAVIWSQVQNRFHQSTHDSDRKGREQRSLYIHNTACVHIHTQWLRCNTHSLALSVCLYHTICDYII